MVSWDKCNLHLMWLIFVIIELCAVQSRNGSYFDCNGIMECDHEVLQCNPYHDCHASCTGTSSCWDTTVICPVKGSCTVDCGNADSCEMINISAIASTSLTWNWGTGGNACEGATVYCPNNGHLGAIACTFNNVNSIALRFGFEVYAVEGFNDVQITGDSLTTGNNIFCGENYQINCEINNTLSPYKCTTCQNILSPSQYPTAAPSNYPTFEPTIQPTNNPSFIPTHIPSDATQYPTNYPSKSPSIYSTEYPAIGPTNNPLTDGLVDNDITTTYYFDNIAGNKYKNKSFRNEINIIIIFLCSLILILICLFIIRRKNRKLKRKSAADEKQITTVMVALESKSTKSDVVIHYTNKLNQVDVEQYDDMYTENTTTTTTTTTKTPQNIEYINEQADDDTSDNELYESPSTNGFIVEGNSPQLTGGVTTKQDEDVINKNSVLKSQVTEEGGDNV